MKRLEARAPGRSCRARTRTDGRPGLHGRPARIGWVAAIAMLAGAMAGCQLIVDFDDPGGLGPGQFAYVKASNTGAGDEFGDSMALDGDTLAVGARFADGNRGAVYVFRREGSTWTQEARLEASNAQSGDVFGSSVALAGDTLAVGAPGEDSSVTGVDRNQDNNQALSSGAVYVFRREGSTWTQEAYLKASNTDAQDLFGTSVAVSGDVLAVGATGEDSAGVGVTGNGIDNDAVAAGAVYVFRREGISWAQEAYLKPSNTTMLDEFGTSMTLVGNRLAVGATGESSAATGVEGDQDDESAINSGAVYVFRRGSVRWVQEAYLKPSNTGADDLFGRSVALSGDRLAVGAPGERSAATGVDGDQDDDTARSSGAVYVFVRDGTAWAQDGYVKPSNTGADDEFGASVALFGDTLAVGARFESSAATGVDGDQGDDARAASGAVYVFERSGAAWAQAAYVKASNTGRGDVFGHCVALSGDELAVGAPGEDSTTTGVGGDQSDNGADNSGAVYSFFR